MKKLFYLIALAFAATWGLGSCDSEPENPGDFGLACEVSTGDVVVSLTDGQQFPIQIARQIDTIYQHKWVKRDTLKDANGDPVKVNGKLQITTDTIPYYSSFTARYYESEPILLPSKADTFEVKILSNSRWLAPVPDNKNTAQWFFNYNSSTTGCGDGTLQFRVTRNRSKERKVWAEQKVFSQDTTVMLNLVFRQAGERD